MSDLQLKVYETCIEECGYLPEGLMSTLHPLSEDNRSATYTSLAFLESMKGIPKMNPLILF